MFKRNLYLIIKSVAYSRLSGYVFVILLISLLGYSCFTGESDLDSTHQQNAEAIAFMQKCKEIDPVEIDSILTYADSAAYIYQKLNWIDQLVQTYGYQGHIAVQAERYDDGLVYLENAMSFKDKVSNKASFLETYNVLGKLRVIKGEHLAALEAFDEAMTIGENAGDTTGIIQALNFSAMVYGIIEDLNLSRRTLRKTIKLSVAHDDYRSAIFAYLNLAVLYEKDTLMADSMLYYSKQALQIVEEQQLTPYRPMVRITVAQALMNQGNYSLANEEITTAINDLDTTVTIRTACIANFVLGQIYRRSGKPNASLASLNKSLKMADKMGEAYLQIEVGEELAKLHQDQGNFGEALILLESTTAKKKENAGGNVRNQINQLRSEIALREKEEEIAQLEFDHMLSEQKSSSEFYKLISISLVGLGVLVVLFNYFRKRDQAKLAERDQLIAEGKLEALRAQMNPHFIFNSFGGIQNFILKSKNSEASSYLDKFANLLKLVMVNSEKSSISLSQEVEILSNYLDLESMRFRKNFIYRINVDPTINQDEVYIPGMMIQPYVENAILHGLAPKTADCQLEVDITKSRNVLIVTVIDNGIGREQSSKLKDPSEHLSIATLNGEQRIKFLREIGYDNSEVLIEDLYENGKPSGTRVNISLPLIKH